MKIRHLGIAVINIGESLEFYSKIGFNNIIRIQKENNKILDNCLNMLNVVVRTYKISNCFGEIVELLDFLSDEKEKKYNENKINEIGLSHFAITIKDLDNIYENFKEKFIHEPQVSIDKKVKLAFCRDPNGVLIEMVEEL